VGEEILLVRCDPVTLSLFSMRNGSYKEIEIRAMCDGNPKTELYLVT